MNVADLAKDLGVPPSAVLERCALLSIDAAWAGADLSSAQEEELRAALAAEAPDPTPSVEATSGEPPVGESPAGGGGTGSEGGERAIGGAPWATGAVAVAPTEGAASTPSEPAPAAAAVDGDAAGDRPAAPPGFYAATLAIGEASALGNGPSRRRAIASATPRRLDPAIRPALVALVVALVAAVVVDNIANAAVVLVGWILVAAMLVVAIWSANRARYRITTHPDQRSGLAIAVGALVVGLVGAVVLGGAIWTVVRSAPAAQAPVGLGGLRSVQELRWGYQRVQLIADNGWERPAKDVDTCWERTGAGKGNDADERVEVGGRSTSCGSEHEFEVVQVVSVDHDADSPYPGPDRLKAIGRERCADELAAHATKGSRTHVEYPTRTGWADADHDLTCVVEAARTKPLGS
ncbi:septum formation family protein [Aquihabitans sp. G128]|uniref:septum formation family protein n=1 Tax=Aquihabitans sp. G128 TaxID=2849779 RepID=UPI001C217650|nr:septum formation family protein [Aquihabitans sp. G128]QXC62576.1 septum formation family protein [Aquihabitans sp. G128]